MRFWKSIREIEWYAVIAILLLLAALVLSVFIAMSAISPLLYTFVVVLGFSAVVSAVFSHRH